MSANAWIQWGSAAFSTICAGVAVRYAVVARRAARRAEDRVAKMRRVIK